MLGRLKTSTRSWQRLATNGSPQLSTLLQQLRAPYSVNTRQISQQKLENLAPDRITMNGLEFYGYHGVLTEEKILGQRFSVDATLYCDLHHAGTRDDLEATTSYAEVYERIRDVVEGRPSKLIENVAENIAASILENHNMVLGVHISVQKPQAPVPGSFASFAIVQEGQKIQTRMANEIESLVGTLQAWK